ncbi:hypothetical protein ABZU32_39450, partial [Sphaerisporangium sp. NPDC005288]
DDPESRIRWGRVALVTVVSVASAGVIWSLLFTPGARTGRPVDVEAAGGTVVITPGESLPPLLDSPPPPPSSPKTTTAPTPAHKATSARKSTPEQRPTPGQASTPGQSPPPRAASASPAPPFVSVAGTVDVGYARHGTASITSTSGTVRWSAAGSAYVTASPSGGTLRDGERGRFRLTLGGLTPGTRSDCDRPLSTYLTITWWGQNKGAEGSGSATVTIAYKKPCPKGS